ncbi:hypothetical protein [Bacillus pumilus]|uniref:hypothetical protein n=1 Tax=Bacillus pumilus TaxID=1408 RepID=UPI0021123AE3|nr:hypothetical protein [Bacillus pumilus]UUD44622.1 hypothetical protein NPA43_18990 [Bacillus pumilus]
MKKGAKQLKTFIAFCKEKLIGVIHGKNSIHRSEFLEFGDHMSIKRVYESGEGKYTLSTGKGKDIFIQELPLYNSELASKLGLMESEFHRLLILASIAHGHLDHLLATPFKSYEYLNWTNEDFSRRARVETYFYGKGTLTAESYIDNEIENVLVDSFHHFKLIVDDQTILTSTAETNNELWAFIKILLNN